MKDEDKTKTQLINELSELRERIRYSKMPTLTPVVSLWPYEEPYPLWITKNMRNTAKIESNLPSSEDKFFKTFYASPVTMSVTTLEEGRILAINNAFCRVLGYSHEEALGRILSELGFWFDSNQRETVIEKITTQKSVRDIEIQFSRKNGENRVGLYSAEGIEISGEPCILSILTDITENIKAAEKIKYLSFHDKLTGLYNRAYFEEELKRLDTERQLPISLIIGDINGLKRINDTLGQQEGDKFLINVAGILKESCRQEDIVARWGGDEFIILLPECSYEKASAIMGRIKTACQKIDTLPVNTTISLGLASKTSIKQDMSQIIREAEDKMYRGKLLEEKSTRSSFLISLEKTLWARSHETEEHCRRMQKLTLLVGQAISLSESDLDNLQLLAALHDIGKIAISNSILNKPGKLTLEECETVKKHPEIGYRIALSSPEMTPIAEAILYHHERWDGNGYPHGIKSNDIPLLSRILAIADCYDVMINGRAYQKSVREDQAWDEIIRCAGSQFDPYLARFTVNLLYKTKAQYPAIQFTNI